MNDFAADRAGRIIVALDMPDYDSAARLVESLGDSVSFYKVGFEMYIRDGDRMLELLRGAGKEIFLDLKLHDIPNTVARAVESIATKNVSLTTLHTMGGFEMMAAAAEARRNAGSKARLLGVTVLTSINENALREDLHIQDSIPRMVRALAEAASKAGIDGVVASPLELSLLREHFSEEFLVVTPGIRPEWAAAGDQKRVMTPKEAFDRGASYIVIGRPVTAHPDPAEAVRRIHDEIA